MKVECLGETGLDKGHTNCVLLLVAKLKALHSKKLLQGQHPGQCKGPEAGVISRPLNTEETRWQVAEAKQVSQ